MTEIAMAHKPESQSVADAAEILRQVSAGVARELQLDPDPIYEKWILTGKPVARSKTLAISPDRASTTVLWDCTSGTFYWHYRQDEAVLFLSGDAYLLDENDKEQRFAAGDFAFFPAGSVIKWRVDKYVRKIAFLREPVWSFAVPALRFWNQLMRKLGLTRQTDWIRIRIQS